MGRRELGFLTGLACLWAVLAVAVSLGLGMEKRMEEVSVGAVLESRMASMDPESLEKQLKIAKWYNYQLEQGKFVPDRDYQSIWNLGEGQMGLLRVPELDLTLPITHGIGGLVGHDPATALPTGGREEQTVLYIEESVSWREGMALETRLPGAEIIWQVESIQIMPPQWPVDHPAGSTLLTLVFDRAENRTIVRCRPGTGIPRELPAPEMLIRQALFWGILPIFLVPGISGLGKILYFIHPGGSRRRILPGILWKFPEKGRKLDFATILRL